MFSSFSNVKDDGTIIRVNNRNIGFQEYQGRLNYFPQTLKLPEGEIKETLVCTLIAETILYYEALHGALDTLERVRLLVNQYSDEAVYEQWMDSEVRARVTVTGKELLSAYTRFTERRSVAFWIVPDRMGATALREKIARGMAPPEKPQFKEIDYAESLESVEKAVYDLKEGEVSSPVLVDGSYYVFQLLKRLLHPEYSKNNFMFWKRSIEKKVRARKETSLLDNKLGALMKGKEYSVKREVYDFLVRQITSMIYDKEAPRFESAELIQQEIGSKEIGQHGIFDQPLITFSEGGQWTAKDFWKRLSVCPYPLNYKNPEDLKNGLLDVVRSIILFESIVKDGKSKRYNNASYVRNQSQMWSGNLLAQALVADYRKSVSVDETELTQYYDSTKYDHLKPEQRKIIPIIVREKEAAEQLREQIAAGANIVSLAEEHSLNKMNLDSNNPGVYVTRDSWGEIGRVAFALKAGQLSETMKNTDSTYAIVKLLEIRPAAPYPFDAVRDGLHVVLEDRHLQQKVERLLSTVVKKYDIRIDRAALKRVEYLGGNMAVKKAHFPLRSAVPGFRLFDPKAKWYQEGVSKN
jgi:peptidyl-prolyl cis-trans isomerase C